MLHKTLIHVRYLFVIIGGLFCSLSVFAETELTIVEKHGALATKGNKIVDKHGTPVSLAGPSLFWSNDGWQGEAFYNAGVVNTVANEWHATVIRAAIGADNAGSVIDSPVTNRFKLKAVIEAAVAEGIYVIVDWHSHYAEQHPEKAIEFFTEIASDYGHLPNVIYEIYNEPLNNTDWETVIKPYAVSLIEAIRKVDPDNLIVVGTQTWSQDVDKAADSPLLGYSNIAYALHFYAGTHKQGLRDRAQRAIDAGLPLFVTEWGTVNANGDGDIDLQESMRWLIFIKNNQLSHLTWSISNKVEGASMIKPEASVWGDWTENDLTANGIFLREIFRAWQTTDAE